MATVGNSSIVLIQNGLVIDPANGVDREPLDVLLVNGLVAQVGSSIPLPAAAVEAGGTSSCEVFDATGCLVCPGLVDMHVHCFPSGTSLGVDPDKHCLSRGVTSVVDAGSAGANAMKKFLEFAETKKARVFSFIHASRIGLESAGCASEDLPGELNDINDVDVQECLSCIDNNRDRIVGIKVRLSAMLANDGGNEEEACRRSLEISLKSRLPLMVHYSFSTIPHVGETQGAVGIPSSLRKGDILTHLYHGFKSTILDVPAADTQNIAIHPSIIQARERGVFLDIGHGMGAFIWVVAEVAAREGIWPDTISTDLHTMSFHGPAYDLATVMTKLLHLGMPVYEIIRSVTHTPAKIIKREKLIGSLSQGCKGDVTVLRITECDVMLEDCRMEKRRVTKKFVPIATWVGGTRVEIKELSVEWPNPTKEHYDKQIEQEELLVDDIRPAVRS